MAFDACPACGASLQDDCLFCAACGIPLTFPCPHCEKPVPLSQEQRCPACRLEVGPAHEVALALITCRRKLHAAASAASVSERVAMCEEALAAVLAALEIRPADDDALRLREQVEDDLLAALQAQADAHLAAHEGLAAISALRRWVALRADDVLVQMRLSELEGRRERLLDQATQAEQAGEFARALELLREGERDYTDDPAFTQRRNAIGERPGQVDAALKRLLLLARDRKLYACREQLPSLLSLAPRHTIGLQLAAKVETDIGAADQLIARGRARIAEHGYTAARQCIRDALALCADHPNIAELTEQITQGEAAAAEVLRRAADLFHAGQLARAEQMRRQAAALGAVPTECRRLEQEIETAQFARRKRIAVYGVWSAGAVVLVVLLGLGAWGGIERWRVHRDLQTALAAVRRQIDQREPTTAERTLERLLDKHPQLRHRPQVRQAQDAVGAAFDAWALGQLNRDLRDVTEPKLRADLLNRFIGQYPQSSYRPVVEASLVQVLGDVEHAAYAQLLAAIRALGDRYEEMAPLYDAFLREYPRSRHEAEVIRQREALPSLLAERDFQRLVQRAASLAPQERIREYDRFLLLTPQSPYREDVRRLIVAAENEAYQQDLAAARQRIAAATGTDTVADECLRFLARHPRSPDAQEFRALLAEQAVQAEAAAFSRLQQNVAAVGERLQDALTACRLFLEKYPNGRYRQDALALIADIERQQQRRVFDRLLDDVAAAASTDEAVSRVSTYIAAAPPGLLRTQAEELLQQLRQRRADEQVEQLWRSLAVPGKTFQERAQMCDDFLHRIPDHPQAQAVQERRGSLLAEWEAALYGAVRQASEAARVDHRLLVERCNAYLVAFPQGRYATEAIRLRKEIAAAQVRRDYANLIDALADPTTDRPQRIGLIESFLDLHGDSPFAADVRRRYREEVDQVIRDYVERIEDALRHQRRVEAAQLFSKALHVQPDAPALRALYDRVSLPPSPTPARVIPRPGTMADDIRTRTP